ncbi:MAG TPA: alkaline phosphatase family protein [Nitrosopumilus sp.]|jgi:2,3-bisphosphoglycerate-independent phosphoglycerate mutase|nr:alkaline phosphatase family protein [Nitrosopumilus sp.]HJL67383.1 alkaline phosphatase family protein [Nitrosopumilus sp.]HJM25583.1 alkaline phosphatase family protein [Nitrosopumilus sp.]HJO31529.1 alkaline phosphatase family protein [Nitrosopumilus sp.]|tara:strand:+ start:70 stop:1356 length:1287 start_codon:yes stop_codon:yes gene_type:complete
MDNSDVHMIYVLLDGVGDLPHPDLDGKTPLEAANTPVLDKIASNGAIGEVISVGKGIAPESDIAVFNMLGYKFNHADYAGRGVIEAIGVGIDFKNGDLALRGNFSTLNDDEVIIDRRAGRHIEKEDADGVAKEIEEKIKFSDPNTSVVVSPTIGHRVTVRIRTNTQKLSSKITNTDPAYSNIGGMGVAKAVGDFLKIEKCLPIEENDDAKFTASLVNEFSEQSINILKESQINEKRRAADKKQLSCILLRDAGNKFPDVIPINEKYGMEFSCIVDMPVELGISDVLKMKAFEAGGLTDYEEKARVAAKAMETQNSIYVHLKGPDEFGHDGDAIGKMKNIEEIDQRFFKTLIDNIDSSKVAIIISADHSTPCINKGHSDDPVPVVVSGDFIKNDGTTRMTEEQAKKGSIGLLQGAEVVSKSLELIKSQK